jgi:hypothetical protein
MNFKDDIIGRIRGIGIATFQHLRMNFGANTVKPDQRVKEVLNKEFKFYSENDIDYISAVEYIAKITGKSALYIDQVFVNYGSGYYSNNDFTKIASDKYFEKLNLKGEEDIIVTNCHAGNIVEQMLEYIKNSIKDLDVFIEKRGDGGYIAVVSKLKHLKRGKNVFTYWPTSSSVAVIILGLLPRKTYYSIQEMEEDKLVTKIKLNPTVNQGFLKPVTSVSLPVASIAKVAAKTPIPPTLFKLNKLSTLTTRLLRAKASKIAPSTPINLSLFVLLSELVRLSLFEATA